MMVVVMVMAGFFLGGGGGGVETSLCSFGKGLSVKLFIIFSICRL